MTPAIITLSIMVVTSIITASTVDDKKSTVTLCIIMCLMSTFSLLYILTQDMEVSYHQDRINEIRQEKMETILRLKEELKK